MTKNVRLEEVGDELILWEDEPLVATVLDPLHARIYRMATEGKSLDEIEQAERTAFRIPPERKIRPVLTMILYELVDQGFLDEEPLHLDPRHPYLEG
jgi:hypothetical protein